MKSFLTEEAVLEGQRKARRCRYLLAGLAAGTLVLFIVICLMTRTGNARAMLTVSWISLILLGWGMIAFRMFAEEPARAEERHLAGLAGCAREIHEGRMTLEEDAFRIPKSVRVCKVRLETEDGMLSLNLNERLRDAVPGDGALVRVETAHKFITGIEVLEPGKERPSRQKASRVKTVLRALGRFFPPALIWAMLVPIVTGFVFARMTDTDPAHKITLYADCEVMNAAELAEKLEKGMDGAVRMVKVHPFSYALFGSEQLKNADLYIVPDSRKADYGEWFSASGGMPDGGLTVYDPESGLVTAGAYFLYTPEGSIPEKYRLYIGSRSPHLEDGLALRAAELLCEMKEPEKEENP